MYKTINDLQNHADAIYCSETLQQWIKAKPKNKSLKKFSDALIRILINNMNVNVKLENCQFANSILRQQRNQAWLEQNEIAEELKKLDKHFRPPNA